MKLIYFEIMVLNIDLQRVKNTEEYYKVYNVQLKKKFFQGNFKEILFNRQGNLRKF